jgi:hypothetical protein
LIDFDCFIRLLNVEPGYVLDDPRIGLRVEPHPAFAGMDLQPEAVVFDLVHPARPPTGTADLNYRSVAKVAIKNRESLARANPDTEHKEAL